MCVGLYALESAVSTFSQTLRVPSMNFLLRPSTAACLLPVGRRLNKGMIFLWLTETRFEVGAGPCIAILVRPKWGER